MSGAVELLAQLRETIGFEALGEPSGNVTIGKGRLEARGGRQEQLHVALIENRLASGALGTVEAKRLGALFRIVASERSALVLFIDSAGAKVSEGLKALGAFRTLYREALAAALSGAPIAAVLGKNCYGGSSMLAHLAAHRLFAPTTQLAMSGPTILAASAGMDARDEMFAAIAQASISGASRAKASAANRVWDGTSPPGEWLSMALAAPDSPVVAFRGRHDALGKRLPAGSAPAWESVRRRDLERLYPAGYELREAAGLIAGTARREEAEEVVVGLVGKSPLGAERAWRFADEAWKVAEARTVAPRMRILLDCATHTARLDDEKIVLSEYIVGMSLPLALAAARGTRVELTVLGAAGGGVYVALAGPAAHVSAVYRARIQVLPGAALAAILGEAKEEAPAAAEYRAAGVAEEEIKLGIVS